MSDEKLLNVREAAALLNISTGTLYHWITESRGVPTVRFSKRCLRFRRLDLERWISQKLVAPQDIGGTGNETSENSGWKKRKQLDLRRP